MDVLLNICIFQSGIIVRLILCSPLFSKTNKIYLSILKRKILLVIVPCEAILSFCLCNFLHLYQDPFGTIEAQIHFPILLCVFRYRTKCFEIGLLAWCSSSVIQIAPAMNFKTLEQLVQFPDSPFIPGLLQENLLCSVWGNYLTLSLSLHYGKLQIPLNYTYVESNLNEKFPQLF